ncbi:unnamed protein product, partial [Symbiodinium sp. CCMP2456]
MMRLVHPDRCSDPQATQAVQELQSFELHLSNSDPESFRQGPMSDLETLLDRAIQPELKQSREPELSQPASKPQPAATGFVLEVGAFGRGSSAPAVPAVRKGILKPKAASSIASLDQFMTHLKVMNKTKAAKPTAAKVAEPTAAKVAEPAAKVAESSEPEPAANVAESSEVAEPTAKVAECSEPEPAAAKVAEPTAAAVAESSESESAAEEASAEPEPVVNGKLGEPLKEYRDHVVAKQDFEHYGPDCPQEAVKRFRDCLYRDEKDASNFNPYWLVVEFPSGTSVMPLEEWNGALAFCLREGDPTGFVLVSKNKGV